MKVTELMINDYIEVNNTIYKVMELHEDGVIMVRDIVYNIKANFTSDYIEHISRPVNLTIDMLKLNGWDGTDYITYKVNEDCELKYYPLEYRVSLYFRNTYSETSCIYVHQLQHFLTNNFLFDLSYNFKVI